MYILHIAKSDLHAVEDYLQRAIKPLASTTIRVFAFEEYRHGGSVFPGDWIISTAFRHECKAVVDTLINIDVNFSFTTTE